MKKIAIIIFITVLVGIAFSQTGTGVIRRFINLTDTPSTYSGQGSKNVRVNSGGTALEFTSGGTGDLLADGTIPLTSNWDVGNYDITLKSLTGDGTIEGATITEGGVAVYNDDEMDEFSELDSIVTDKSLVNMADGATWLGVHTYGGATTVIPWKVDATAAPTVEGQAIWESDTDELTVGDGAASIVIAAKTNTVFCFNIHDIDSGMDDIKMPFTRATTITKVTAFVTGGTNVVGRLYEVDGDGDDADAVGVESSDWTFTAGETEDSSFNNATFDAGDYIQWDTTSVSGSVTGFMISVEGYEI